MSGFCAKGLSAKAEEIGCLLCGTGVLALEPRRAVGRTVQKKATGSVALGG